MPWAMCGLGNLASFDSTNVCSIKINSVCLAFIVAPHFQLVWLYAEVALTTLGWTLFSILSANHSLLADSTELFS